MAASKSIPVMATLLIIGISLIFPMLGSSIASAAHVSELPAASNGLETLDQEINDPMFLHILVVGAICIVILMVLLHYRQKYKD